MVSIVYLGLTCSLLLLVLCTNSGFSKTPDTASRAFFNLHRASNRDINDERWRMSSAISALNFYTNRLSMYYAENRSAMIRISIDDDRDTLRQILSRVCNLVAFYELATKVDPTTNHTNLYPLLSEVIRTSCNWVKYLLNEGSMTIIGSLNDLSCSPTGVTPLHHYCYRMRASNLSDLTDIGGRKLNDKLADYFGNIPAQSWEEWLNTTTLSDTQKDSINVNIKQGIRNILLAVLQYIMNYN